MMANFFNMLYKEARLVRTCCFIFAAGVLLWTLFFAAPEHPHTWLEAHVPAFWSIFTIVACLVLVIFSKIYGACGIKREEDYYDK